MKKNIFILLSLINFSFTQVSIESIPRSLLLDNNLVPEEIILPQINLEQLMEEDILERKSGITKPYRFAKTIEVARRVHTLSSSDEVCALRATCTHTHT